MDFPNSNFLKWTTLLLFGSAEFTVIKSNFYFWFTYACFFI